MSNDRGAAAAMTEAAATQGGRVKAATNVELGAIAGVAAGQGLAAPSRLFAWCVLAFCMVDLVPTTPPLPRLLSCWTMMKSPRPAPPPPPSYLPPPSTGDGSRLAQLVEWCGGAAFDGLLVLDECHKVRVGSEWDGWGACDLGWGLGRVRRELTSAFYGLTPAPLLPLLLTSTRHPQPHALYPPIPKAKNCLPKDAETSTGTKLTQKESKTSRVSSGDGIGRW